MIEYGGAGLAFFKLTQAVQFAALPALLVLVFWGGLTMTWAGAGIFAAKLLLVIVIFILVRNTSPRVRIDQAMRFFWGPVTAMSLAALALAGLGY